MGDRDVAVGVGEDGEALGLRPGADAVGSQPGRGDDGDARLRQRRGDGRGGGPVVDDVDVVVPLADVPVGHAAARSRSHAAIAEPMPSGLSS